MTTLILTFAAMLLLTAAMAVGVIFGRKPIAGSCGGMKALGMETECEVCGGQPELCKTGTGKALPGSKLRGPSPQEIKGLASRLEDRD
ncbi:MAG: (Na+)-NQR maturation NqrM [Gammaproteobacteria bacterium TMED134]|nr:MAG: (Na+)-NQR maturation NqrM [Gammaproteobacteria bacterium TMED134]RZO71629.1 MAG: (Na+)-NQR maturation NqrM [OM182 bacterium]HBK17603.1 ApbE family protein [Gammaproteobacteria bacterium]|tara:strand:+ start:12325 stop:12588 length:264 start_codon:yes stop_codon:yes gene_type:complete